MNELALDYIETDTCIQAYCTIKGRNEGFCAPHYVSYVINRGRREMERKQRLAADNARKSRTAFYVLMRTLATGRLKWTTR